PTLLCGFASSEGRCRRGGRHPAYTTLISSVPSDPTVSFWLKNVGWGNGQDVHLPVFENASPPAPASSEREYHTNSFIYNSLQTTSPRLARVLIKKDLTIDIVL